MADLTDKELLEYEKVSSLGDLFAEMLKSPFYAALETHVLKPMEQRAFADFATVSPDDRSSIAICQQTKLAVDRVRQKIEEIIQTGSYAKAQLTYSTRKDEEYA